MHELIQDCAKLLCKKSKFVSIYLKVWNFDLGFNEIGILHGPDEIEIIQWAATSNWSNYINLGGTRSRLSISSIQTITSAISGFRWEEDRGGERRGCWGGKGGCGEGESTRTVHRTGTAGGGEQQHESCRRE